ncbi:conserved hypothetical protein [Microsporum canis CBS 113480]|uniref:Fungal-type protein kinase domain-containing protein n=1 Tax=Arthroderma otae (strain ATCC MYA-4605 / CBS 113480) TaxID=554155 RepID=C5G049_ARTOC|nr:conserved hypothetical protein [Microsporum canis CBS 113480]EEQ35502.1 conserved hypothetical protein [Microsporum canis CBS 113480]
MSPSRAEIIDSHPIGDQLDRFRDLYSICRPPSGPGRSVSGDASDVHAKDIKTKVFAFLVALTTLPVCHELPSRKGAGALYVDVLGLAASFEVESLFPLLKAVRDREPDETIWNKVYEAVTESTPPPRPPPPSFQQTPWVRNTSSFANSNEYRKHVDGVLKEELGDIYVDITGFYDTFFGDVPELQARAQAVLERCMEGEDPLYREGIGWRAWPEDTKEAPVLAWLLEVIDKITQFFEGCVSGKPIRRRPLAQPHKPIQGSTAERKLDVGFMDGTDPLEDGKYAWSQILVPGELKNDPGYDTQSRLDLGRYAREVLAAQDSRHFVPGFTLCGPHMRLWHFDRLGGIASEQFNINEEGLRFISVILTYLLMDTEQLGFDPTIVTTDVSRYIKIERDGKEEHLVIDKVYGRDNDVRNGVRKGLDITTASNYKPAGSRPPPRRSGSRRGRSSGSRKRSSTCVEPSLPPSKRTHPGPLSSTSNRVHRRVVVQDYGEPIYRASSRVALLAALEGCIDGYGSLYQQAGMLQSDISPNNLLINEDARNTSSWTSFLIDLDLAIKEQRDGASGARGKTGTRAFMAIGVLLGDEQHSFMHDLESFFWVLFWICIHYEGPTESKANDLFEKWNFMDTEELAKMKLGTVTKEAIFMKTAMSNFTPYYQSLVPHVNRLRREVFPADKPWEKEDRELYSRMKKILQDAQADPEVLFEEV